MLQLTNASARCGLRQSTKSSWSVPVFIGRSRGIGGRPVAGFIPSAQPEQRSSPKPVTEDEELPPWIRREKERELQAQQGSSGLPWPLYLLFSIFTAIAAVGSIFEFVDRNPVFGVLPPDNPLWAPILLFFAVTGFPTAGFLFIKGVNGFNEDAERQDKLDGYL
ncbi:hypothetical protein VOLCADRAFT_104324 [Volvox carteri f. nagariensis]|uniref:Transmembrane protein n=1 Tax=Volvox carteri f. nagariensis TaxID=3068 RepID=D8TSW7_VOLCA|nr:uncharacterized protein VOLCADRAFT_104324 [Volvox carteri f. nagariensis]EFJ49553.1 hypothetical protein VOLCADRAFT_104324 [Volvox carteri f. nagariensis]|eukprot:XP_002949534.1 hypothetical protein VOLCADRAFT_104324 [Volvox carteri f. nagariensis]